MTLYNCQLLARVGLRLRQGVRVSGRAFLLIGQRARGLDSLGCKGGQKRACQL